MKNLLEIFNTLGVNKENGLFITSEGIWEEECQFSSRVGRLINNKLKPDAFFVFDHKPLILFYDSPHDKELIHKSLWNFNESPVVFFAYDDSVEIYNGYHYLKDDKSLELLAGIDSLSDFNYFELVSGKTWEKYQPKLTNAGRVDFQLLKNIKAARNILVERNKLESNIANVLIGKIIFVRYLIDREIKIGFDEERCWKNKDLCALLSNRENTVLFFRYLEKKFNGDMFLLNDSQYEKIEQPSLNTLISLLNEDDLGDGQQSLFKLYDFSIIPIEFISNVYESFIGNKNQADEGAYYTPLFLVDYILHETVEKHLINNSQEYNCKVLDPACGSGIFLVETLRKIIERYMQLHPEVAKDTDEFKDILRQLAVDNIFGIDKNIAAIQVAIFSIQLTLLDYQQPSSVETFKFPKLLHTNFFEADFFDTKHDYNKVLKHNGIRFIIGNPPWKRGQGDESSLFAGYIKDRKNKEKQAGSNILPHISNKEIAQAFLLRVSDFNVENEIAMIATSKVLYNLNAKSFRQYFLDKFILNKVFELAPVRHYVFDQSSDPAIAPAVVLFYQKAETHSSTDDNTIEHIALKPSRFFKMFKIFTLTRNDFKKVQQKKLKEYDWLWKTLVYGSYLDFNLINRLKSNYQTIEDELKDETKYLVGQGVTIGGGDENDASHLTGKSFLKTTQKNIQPFWVQDSILDKWKCEVVHRPRNRALFDAPMLLLKKGISNEFSMTSAVCVQNVVFTDSLTAVKLRNDNDIRSLHTMSAILNSKLFSYLALNTFSSAGIEREQVHEEKWNIPFVNDMDILSKVRELEDVIKKRNKDDWFSAADSQQPIIKNMKRQLDDLVLSKLDFSEKERSLIDYSNDIVIPIQMEHDNYEALFSPLGFENELLNDYVTLFLNRFSKSLNTETHYFMAEVWYSKQIIGIFFKVVPKSDDQNTIVWIDKSKDDLLKKAISLSSQKITDKLFVQKDLRGFEEDFFYIFKPNEKRLWHKAVGYQDVDEFMDAILKTGRRNYG